MSEMIERVAKAMIAHQCPDGKGTSDPRRVDIDGVVDFVELARVALAATREPTPEMCEAAKEAVFSSTYLWPELAAEAYKAMIDASLK